AFAIRAGAVGRVDERVERVAVIERAEDSAAQPKDARDVARRQDTAPVRFEQAVEAVFEAQALDPAAAGGFDDSSDDGVQAGRVAAARKDAKPLDRGHVQRL